MIHWLFHKWGPWVFKPIVMEDFDVANYGMYKNRSGVEVRTCLQCPRKEARRVSGNRHKK